MEDTLSIQWLGIAGELGQTLRTTNCIEHLNSTLDKWTRTVCYRNNSAPVRHWVALALIHAEPDLNLIPNRELHNPIQTGRVIRGKLDSESDPNWTGNPR